MMESTINNKNAAEQLSVKYWETRYVKGQTGWDRGDVSPQLAYWCDEVIGENQSILVPGCGRGYELVAFAQRGHRVTGIDFAESAIKSASKHAAIRGVSLQLIQEDLFAHTPNSLYDVIYEQTCLCAIHPSQWVTYEQLLYSWLKPGGTLLAHFMQSSSTGGPPFHCALASMQHLFPSDRWKWNYVAPSVQHTTGMEEIPCFLERRSA